MSSANFEMYTTAGERSARDTLRYFEQVRSFFAQTMPHAVEDSEKVRIVAFNSAKEYEPYRINEFAIAYYQSAGDHDYIVMSHTGSETFPTAIHEYVHLVVRHDNLELPPWLNEGVAELYSTLKPMGDKILVGSLVPGRHQALLQDKWVPLPLILGASHESAYYNEKNKAGSLYNEGWALTHMLALSAAYRDKFAQLVAAISGGAPSADALEKIYGKSLSQIETDLTRYLRGGQFQGVLIPAKLEKSGDELKAEPADDFDVKLLLAEVADRPGHEDATHKALDELIAMNRNRPEPYIDLAYLDWQEKRASEAREQFGKAFELGSRNPRMLWDFGRLAEATEPSKSIGALAELLKQQPDRLEVRLELASVQLRSHAAKDAIQTLEPVKKVKQAEAAKFLTLTAYANIEAGSRETARTAAEQLKRVSTSMEDRDQADRLLKFLDASEARAASKTPAIAFSETQAPPTLKHSDTQPHESRPPVVRRASFTGAFTELRCGPQATIVLETSDGKKLLLIEDPTKLLINGSGAETMDLNCGVQKSIQVRIEYDPAGAGHGDVNGVARVIHFNP
jgi:hypothetical protein